MSKRQATIINTLAVISGLFFRTPIIRIGRVLIPKRYSTYSLDNNYSINKLVIAVAVLIPFFCLWCVYNEDDGKLNSKLSTMFIFSALNILFTFLNINSNQMGRLAFYFVSSYIVIIPNSIKRFTKNSRGLAIFIISALCFIYFWMGSVGGTLKIDNFKFFWEDRL